MAVRLAKRLVTGSSGPSFALVHGINFPKLAGSRWLATDVEYRDRAPVDLHFVSGKPDQTEPGLLYRCFPTPVGSSLKVALPNTAITSIDVKVGHLEEIAIEVLQPALAASLVYKASGTCGAH